MIETKTDIDGVTTEGTPENEAAIKEADFLRVMRDRYDRGIEADVDRAEAADDLRFGLLGEQWKPEIRKEREADGRPCLTINKLPERVEQITGAQRKKNIAIKTRAVDDESDVKTSEVLNGLFQNIAHNTEADNAYDEAFDSAAWCGRGFFRILNDYADDDVFEQDIFIEAIQERFSVVLDPAGKKYDRTDGRWLFIEQTMQRADFEEQYKDQILSDWETGSSDSGWITDDEIRVVEYYWKVGVAKKLYLLENGMTVDELPEGARAVREREVQTDKVMWCKATGSAIIEGGYNPDTKEIGMEIPGKYIPVVPVWGKSITVDGKIYSRGAIRFAKEPARMYNFWRSEEYEYLIQQPKSPYTATAAQIKPYKEIWDNAHKKPFPYLPYAHDENAPGPPQRQFAPQGANAFSGQAQISHDEINSTVGIHNASIGDTESSKSGRAIGLLQEKGDTGSFQFEDNLKKSLKCAGKIIMGMLPYIYDTERVVRIKNADGSTRAVKINTKDEHGNHVFDLTVGKYDAYIDAGPDYSTQRQQSIDFFMQLTQTAPQTASAIMDIIVRNADIKDAPEAEARLRKLLPPGMITEPREGEELPQPPPPDPMIEIEQKKKVVELAQEEARLEGLKKDNHVKDLEGEKERLEIMTMVDANPRLGPHLGDLRAGFKQGA